MATDPRHYYDSDVLVTGSGLPGTGIVGLILGDQLHPPMVDDAGIWSDGARWKEGAELCTRRLAEMAGIGPADRVLDVGCGVGGPARLLAREYGCRVEGLNVSRLQLDTAKQATRAAGLEDRVAYVAADVQAAPFRDGALTCVWSFNMFYHVADKPAALGEMHRVLAPGGRLALDDWMITPAAQPEDVDALRWHWSSPGWCTVDEVLARVEEAGFRRPEVRDYSHVGKGVMREHFGPVFERDLRPRIARLDPAWGDRMADDFRAAVDHTIELYCAGKLRYLQLVAVKGEG